MVHRFYSHHRLWVTTDNIGHNPKIDPIHNLIYWDKKDPKILEKLEIHFYNFNFQFYSMLSDFNLTRNRPDCWDEYDLLRKIVTRRRCSEFQHKSHLLTGWTNRYGFLRLFYCFAIMLSPVLSPFPNNTSLSNKYIHFKAKIIFSARFNTSQRNRLFIQNLECYGYMFIKNIIY